MNTLKRLMASIGMVGLPLLFLPVTREFYETNKTAVLLFSATAVVWVVLIRMIVKRNITVNWESSHWLLPIIALVIYLAVHTVFWSTNPYQDIVTGIYGATTLLPMVVYSLLLTQLTRTEKNRFVYPSIVFAACVEVVIIVITVLYPSVTAGTEAVFSTTPGSIFNTFGNQFDTYSLFLFAIVILLLGIGRTKYRIPSIFAAFFLLLLMAAQLTRTPISNNYRQYAPIQQTFNVLSARAHSPQLLLLGSGVRSFEWVFPTAKDSAYNASENWRTATFLRAPSALVQLAIEGGIVGVILIIGSFILLISAKRISGQCTVMDCVLLALAFTLLLIFPVSWYALFQLFVIFGLATPERQAHARVPYGALFIVALLAIGLTWLCAIYTGYYRAEIATRGALNAISEKNARTLYQKQGEAVSLFPYLEQYRVDFSQTNVLLAQELTSQNKPNQEYVTQSVQTAIQEAQSAVALNPRRASNWANLGIIYEKLLGIEGANTWAVAALQRAILLDPQNVAYRLELGTVYYSMKAYPNAVALFEEAVSLKPDHASSIYHLAYGYYRAGSLSKSLSSFNRLLAILKNTNPKQYQTILHEKEKLFAH